MTTFVGLDRLCGVMMPNKYRLINTKIYMTVCLLIVIIIALYYDYENILDVLSADGQKL